MLQIIRGKEMAAQIREEIKNDVERIRLETGKVPGLAVIQVGEDPGSTIYVNNKKKACAEAGIRSFGFHLPAEASERELLDLVETLNEDPAVHGILCQFPIPKHMSEYKVLCTIAPRKDVDGLTPFNIGLLSMGREGLVSATPSGVLEMLDRSGIEIAGKECVIIGRSNLVGKPIAQLMLGRNATVTLAHSKTKNLPEVCRRADILIVAIGKPRFVTADYVKPGAVVIDVGINRDENGKVTGDVDFDSASAVAGALSPVPNGVGPMTIAMLLKNTMKAFAAIEKITL